MPGIVPDDGKIRGNETDKIFCLHGTYILVGWEKNNTHTGKYTVCYTVMSAMEKSTGSTGRAREEYNFTYCKPQ